MRIMSKYCAECNACIEICKHNAITFVENEEGFSYPFIDESKCINCHLCEQVCPLRHTTEILHNEGLVLAAQSRNKSILRSSSSGGIFSHLSQYIIKNKGIVYGAAWDNKFQLRHIGIENINDLDQLKGSKYVHSQINHTYKEIREHLKNNRLVYFTGTPCQVGGLRLFLKHDYPNLLTTDLVCHGTPSQKLFNKIVAEIEKSRKGKIKSYYFRDKSILGWNCASSSFRLNNKKVIYDTNMRAYFLAFIKGDITRMDCYKCPFSCSKRVGDITLADYWDIEKQHPDFPNISKGVSLIIINTEKGQKIWNQIQNETYFTQSSIEKVLQTCNTNLKHPTIQPKTRFTTYHKAFNNYNEFIKSYIRPDDKQDFYKVYIKRIMKKNIVLRLILNILGK